jgi:A nuclease family of the HNH/ENDO VII superfamily with conserved AHH
LVDRKYSDLSTEEITELEKEYTITERGEESRPVFTRHQPKEEHAPIHAEQENGEWVIKKGLEQNNNRISNPYAMDRNFEAEYGPKPEDHQTHHLIPDETYQKNELTAELTERAKAQGEKPGIDKAENLIAQPNGAAAFNDESPEVQALEDKEALAKIVHNGSHPEWNKHANELLDNEVRELRDANPGKTLQEIPTEELKQAEKSVMQQLRQELRDAAQQIKEGHPENLPSWIKPDYVPKDGNGQEFPKISGVPGQVPANSQASLQNGSETPETQQSNGSIKEWLQKQIDINRELYPLPQLRNPQNGNTIAAALTNPPKSPQETLDSSIRGNKLNGTLGSLLQQIEQLETLARQSPAQQVYESNEQTLQAMKPEQQQKQPKDQMEQG